VYTDQDEDDGDQYNGEYNQPDDTSQQHTLVEDFRLLYTWKQIRHIRWHSSDYWWQFHVSGGVATGELLSQYLLLS